MLRSVIAARIQDAPCEAPWKFQLAGWHGRCTLRLFNGRVMFGYSDGWVGAGQPRADARVLENPAHPGSVWILSHACFTEEGGPITMDDGNQLYVDFQNRVAIANRRDVEFAQVPDESRTWIVNQGIIRLLDGRQICLRTDGFLDVKFEGCRGNDCAAVRLWYQHRKRCAVAKATARAMEQAEATVRMLQQANV